VKRHAFFSRLRRDREKPSLRQISSGDATVRDLAKAEGINESYLGRILRLTLLSPTIIEAFLEGTQPATIELDDLLARFA
jgi:hypothetical protein